MSDPSRLPGPAIALLEIESIAKGFVAADRIVKRAKVEIFLSEATTPGKFLLLFSGGVAEVVESLSAGEDAAGPALIDRLYLPGAAAGLIDGLRGKLKETVQESIGIVETHTVASALRSADAALKRAEVSLIQLKLAKGIGGKGYFVLTGALHMVQAALEGAASAIAPSSLLTTELIEQPHSELSGTLL